MNHSLSFLSLTLAASLIATPALAHDPKEHAKERAAAHAKADCAAMKNMDMSKMDANDPVAMAMHKKCAATNAAHHHPESHDHGQAKAKPDNHGAH